MRGCCIAAALLGLLAGCGGGGAPQEAELPEARQTTAPELRAEALELHHYPPGSTGETQSQPDFSLWANTYIYDSKEERFEIEGVRIEIAEDGERGPITLESGDGVYDKDRAARLAGGVQITMGEMLIATEELTYTVPDGTTPGELATAHPVTIKGPEQDLRADSLRMVPDTGRMTLTGLKGTFSMGDLGI